MLVPRIKFYEINEGVVPVRPNVRNRIGMVAPTSRGPTDFQFLGGYTHFAMDYGMDNSVGSIAFQAAYDQGAREFGFTRVLGKERIAFGEIQFSGISTKANKLQLKLLYAGDAVNRTGRDIASSITVSGVPLTQVNGRLWFRVQSIDDKGFARIATIYIPEGTNSVVDWSEVKTELPVGWVYAPDGSRLVPDPNNPPTIIHNGQSILLDRNYPWDNILPEWVPSIIEVRTEVIPEVVYPNSSEDAVGNRYEAGTYNYFELAGARDFEITKVRPTSTILVNLKEDAGRPISAPFGVYLSFGALEQIQDIELDVGDCWSVRIITTTQEVNIYEGYAPNQIATAVMEALSGVNPLGTITRNEMDNGVRFHLMEELGGAAGNRFAFYIDITTPDGEVICDTTYYGGERYAHIPIQFAHLIEDGALVEMVNTSGRYGMYNFSDPDIGPSSEPNTVASIVPPQTRVVKVELPLVGDLAMVWFDKPLNAPFNSIAPFRFINSEGLSFTNHTFYNYRYMQGGMDGPRRAFRDFFDHRGTPILRVISSSEGQWANSLRVDIYPIDNRSFRLTVRDLNKDNYSPPLPDEVFNVSFQNVTEDGIIPELNSSVLIRGVFLPKFFSPRDFNTELLYRMPMRTAPPDYKKRNLDDPANPAYYGPKYLKGISLEGGYDGPPPNEADYVSAIEKMASKAVHIILAPGIYKSEVIKQALISQTEMASEMEGLRIAVLNAPPNMKPASASSIIGGVVSPRVVTVGGWATYAGQANAPRFGLSPDALYAGKLAAIPFYVSPAARTSAGAVRGITETDVDQYTSMNLLQQFSDARFELVYRDPTLLGFYFLNGRNVSTDTRWDKITKRRTYDVVRMDLFQSLQLYKSEPLTGLLLRQISSSIDSYMQERVRRGEIQNYSAASVTAPDMLSGIVEVRLSFLPIAAADYIDIYLIDQWGAPSRPST